MGGRTSRVFGAVGRSRLRANGPRGCGGGGVAPAAPDGVHREGVMMMSFDKEARVTAVVESVSDLVRVKLEAGGRESGGCRETP